MIGRSILWGGRSMEEIELVKVKYNDGNSCCSCLKSVLNTMEDNLNIGNFCVTSDPDNKDDLKLGQVIFKLRIPKQKSPKSIPKVVRKATEEDINYFNENENKEREAFEICLRKIKDRGLPMKLIKSKYSYDRSKITFYFSSEKRVDFRDLVKDLAYIFKRRIELRQIGVRDEAKMMGGYGCCGQELCCTVFLKKLGRLRIKMAREQNMTLTPSKISGICGRLLCCLEFENDLYRDLKGKTAKAGGMLISKKTKTNNEDTDILNILQK